MYKKKASKFEKITGHKEKQTFLTFLHNVTNSLAFKSLSSHAVVALVKVANKYNGSNNGEIHISCREIESTSRMSRSTANRALKELISAGLIKKTKDCYFSCRDKDNLAPNYMLTYFASHDGKPPTNEWREVSNNLAIKQLRIQT